MENKMVFGKGHQVVVIFGILIVAPAITFQLQLVETSLVISPFILCVIVKN